MSGIFRPIVISPLKHIYNMLTHKEYFTFNTLIFKFKKIPRYKNVTIKIDNYNLLLPDARSFLYAYRDIFLDRVYEFKAQNETPKILDIGANIGLSVLFFKQLYPQAEITAFEADSNIFSYLKKNVCGNGYNDVRLIDKAVWHENTTLEFVSEGSDAGHVATAETQNSSNNIKIEAVDIADILREDDFEFIKMDIEGAEEYVVPRCKNLLDRTRYIFIEYHSKIGKQQCLDEIINILTDAGFRVHLHSIMQSSNPFVSLKTNDGFDQQLNIFGWKEK